MERMENSIHELIAALHQTAHQQQQPTQPLPPPRFDLPPVNTDGAGIDEETDEDDNITRPTNAGTEESEERRPPVLPSLMRYSRFFLLGWERETDSRIAGAGGDY